MKAKTFRSGLAMFPVLVVSLLFLAQKGQSQYALHFESPGDYLEIPHHETLAPAEFTLEFWIKLYNTGDPAAAGGEQTILDKRDNGAGFNLRLAGTAFPLPVFAFVEPGVVAAYDAVRRHTWHHVAVTQDSDSLKIYFDGAYKSGEPNLYNRDTKSPLRVGEFLGYPGAYLGLRGELDDLRFWNHARTGTEIRAAMHEKLTGMESGLAAYWDFDTLAGTTLYDLSPNGNDGSVYGNARLVLSEAPVGFVPPGKPVGLRAYGGEQHVELAWTPVAGNITEYLVYRGDSASFLPDEPSLLDVVKIPETGFIDSTVAPGVNYYYCVRASGEGHTGPGSSVALGRTLVVTGDFETGVYYYPWYGPLGNMHEWDGQYMRDLLVPRQPPLLGHYSSRDPLVIRQHLKWMEDCGVDFAVMSWWGITSREDLTIRDYICPELIPSSVQFSIYYESAMLGIDQGRIHIDETNEAKLLADFNYIADTYFDHPNYLRINNKPVIFLYLSGIYDGDFKGAFTRIRGELSAKGVEVFLVGDEVGWDHQPANHMEFLDAVSPYIVLPRTIREGEYPGNGDFFADLSVTVGEWEKTAHPLGLTVIPDVIPGFSNRHGTLPGFAVPRQFEEDSEGTSLLEEYIRVMLPFVDPEQKMIMITSWNEWHEDTQVEPTIVSAPTNQDISASGHLYTWNYTYEGYGIRNLELIRQLLAGDLPPVDTTLLGASSPDRPAAFRIYPNPVYDMVTIETEKPGPGVIEIRDVKGILLTHERVNGSRFQVDLSAFPQGIYFLRFTTGDFMADEKIVKL